MILLTLLLAICTWISQQVAGQKIAITTAFMMNSTVTERNLETFIEFWFDPKKRDYRFGNVFKLI